MADNLAQKIIKEHLLAGEMRVGQEITIKIDQTLIHEASGTMAFLQLEAMGIDRVGTELSLAYMDHNTLQSSFESADDHAFMQDMAAKIGVYYSKPGNGICHQVHLERFGKPGKTLLGADSHTATNGGIGMLAIGAGGMDLAIAMKNALFYLIMPKTINVKLNGRPAPWVSAKDIVLEVLRRLKIDGGLRSILEYSGSGLQYLSVPERSTIANMGAETGATSSIFPSDEITREFLRAQGRDGDWLPLAADAGCAYDLEIEIDLSALEPLVACPFSPGKVKPVAELSGLSIDQVIIGSCTNSSYLDISRVAQILKGQTVHTGVSLALACGSKQVLRMAADDGSLSHIIAAGGRVLECACGPCVGMGQAPKSGGVSLRTINRNFKGRSGTADAEVYLVSPETAAVSAIRGALTSPRELGRPISITMPQHFIIDDSLIIAPAANNEASAIVRRGKNIKPLTLKGAMADDISGEVLLKVGDDISTDHIMPAGSKILPLRSNIPAIAEYVFQDVDAGFPAKAKAKGGGLIVAGDNYGQGSSREHAASAPAYLGVTAVITKSCARIHHDNLVNFGIVPLSFADPADYGKIEQGHTVKLSGIRRALVEDTPIFIEDLQTGQKYELRHVLTPRQREILSHGGKLNWAKAQQS